MGIGYESHKAKAKAATKAKLEVGAKANVQHLPALIWIDMRVTDAKMTSTFALDGYKRSRSTGLQRTSRYIFLKSDPLF